MSKIKATDGYECGFCGSLWKTDSDGEPECCDEAIQDWLDRGMPEGG